jgi:ParB family chromosome partitioning protein
MAEKTKLKIEYVAIGSIKLNPKNPRKNDEAVDKIVGSMEQFDWTNPILVRKTNKTIIAGNTRYKSAKKLGIKTVPVVFLDMTEKKADAYMLADNKLNELAPWDDAALAKIIADLQSQEVDVKSLGFQQFEINSLLGEVNNIEDEFKGMPEFEQEDLSAFKTIKVHFKNEEDLKKFSKLIKQTVALNTKSIWYPPAEILHWADKHFVDEK